jgi:hypothetical protein
MKPTFAVLRLDNAGDPKKQDYEAYICDGKAVYAYSGLAKTITEFELPKAGAGVDNLMLDFLAGMKAKTSRSGSLTLFKPTTTTSTWTSCRGWARTSGSSSTCGWPCTARARVPRTWRTCRPRCTCSSRTTTRGVEVRQPAGGPPGVEAKHFQYVEVKGFTKQQAPKLSGGPSK